MNKDSSLSYRAGLTFLSNLLQSGSRLIIGILVTPIVIRGLGAELYGCFQMIQQTVGYLSLSDMRPMGTLRLTIGIRQHVDDIDEKRRQIGSALLLWSFTFPIFVVLGALAVWRAPQFIRVAPYNYYSLRWALAIIILSVALDRLFSLPSNVLRGMNLDYKAMGLNAATILIAGLLSVFAIWGGYGLVGVAGATVLGVCITSVARFWVAIKALPWFKPAKPSRQEFIKFVRLSGWHFLYGLSSTLLIASDFLLVGYLLGPSSAAVYATTGLALKMTSGFLANFLGSANPGMLGVCGQKDWQRLIRIRTEMFTIAIAGMAIIGSGIIALNEKFLTLWVGDGFYAGHLTNYLLVVAAVIRTFFKIDTVIVTALLELRRQAISTLVSGALVIVIGALLCPIFGIPGMVIGSLFGYTLQWTYLQFILYKHAKKTQKAFFTDLSMLSVKMIFMYTLFFYLGFDTRIKTWFLFTFWVISFAVIAVLILWCFIFNKDHRNLIAIKANGLRRSII